MVEPLNNGQVWYAWIDYNQQSTLLEVRISQTNQRPVQAFLSDDVDLTYQLNHNQAYIDNQAYIGFTSGTGGALYNNRDILSWEFTTIDHQPKLSAFVPNDVAWGDYNNDGNIDALFTRNKDGQPITQIYKGDPNGNLTLLPDNQFLMTSIQRGEATWGDYDNDGDLDILLTGAAGRDGVPFAQVYRNNVQTKNDPPAEPIKDLVTFVGDSRSPGVRLSWHSATDDHTNSGNLTYNLKIGTTPGESIFLLP